MASNDVYDDEFQLVNEFENLNHDELMDKDHVDVGEEMKDEDENVETIEQTNALKQEELKFQENKKKLKEEYENINKLKKELQLKFNEQSEIIEKNQQALNMLKQQSNEYNQLSANVKKEFENLKTLRLSIEEDKKKLKSEFEKLENERKDYEKNCNELKTILAKFSNKTNDNKMEINSLKNKEDIFQQLSQLLNSSNNNCDQIQQEITRIRQLRQQQEDLIKQAKIEIETVQSTHNAHLITKLDTTQAYCCKDCGTHIALENDVESRCYQVGQGTFSEKKRGFLFKNAYNLVLGATKTETFTTGSYNIAWVSCVKCQQQIGWKYLSTDNPNNTSKVGKFCLARYSLVSPQDTKEKDNVLSSNATTVENDKFPPNIF